MTHLRIELSNVQENVSSAVVAKLYELATNGDLDVSSNLAGNIHTTATYQEYIDGIRNRFNDLTITSDSIYIWISDPEVRRVMATRFGNGTNISALDLTGVTEIPNLLFKNNTDILTFNELGNLRGITRLGLNAFDGCSSLTSIDTSNITSVGSYALKGCSSLTSVNFSNVTHVGALIVNGSGLTRVVFPNIIDTEGLAFMNSPLTYIEFGENLTTLAAPAFWDSAKLKTIVFRGTTPVSYSDSLRSNKFLYSQGSLTIYVPDNSVSAYLAAWPAVSSCITGISNLPS